MFLFAVNFFQFSNSESTKLRYSNVNALTETVVGEGEVGSGGAGCDATSMNSCKITSANGTVKEGVGQPKVVWD